MSSSKFVMGIPSTMNDDHQLNLRKLFERGVELQPNNLIITKIQNGYHRMTYSHCQYRATKLASALSTAGIKPGDRVGTFMFNNARHFILYYAVPSMGAVLHTINPRLHPSELGYIIQHAEDKILFIDNELMPIFEQIPSEYLKNVKLFVICGDNQKSGFWTTKKLENVIDFELFEAKGKEFYEWPELSESTAMGLCYTSGTTGNPKGVLYSHRSTYLHTLLLLMTDVYELSGVDCIFGLVPMFHALNWGLPFAALTLGCKVLLHNNLPIVNNAPAILDFCLQENCSLIAGVPTVISEIRLALESNPSKYAQIKGTLKRIACGGTAPAPSLIEYFYKNWSIEVVHLWGMTETNPLGTMARRIYRYEDKYELNDEQRTQNQNRAGVRVPSMELKVVDLQDNNKELPHDGKSMGELLVKAPHVTKSYFKIDAKDKFHNGWLKTGDVVTITPRHEIVICDRDKDVIKSGGEWISSKDMENYIKELPMMKDVCVVGWKHPRFDEVPIVLAVLKENCKESDVSLSDIRQHLSKWFASFQLPKDLIIVKELPYTGTGKVSKKTVRENLQKSEYNLPESKKAKL